MKSITKYIRKAILPLMGVVAVTSTAMAQIVGGNAFMPGNWVEVGVAPCGSYGTTNPAPAGYHPKAPTTGNALGFVADAAQNGWTVGVPDRCGDYFLPGTPEEGWGLTINGTNYNNNLRCGATGTGGIPGSIIGYTNSGGLATTTWQGTVAGLQVTQQTELGVNNLYFVTRVTLTNTNAFTLNNIYYMRNVDPDNEQPTTGNFVTTNTIIDQNPNPAECFQALVQATGTTYGCYLGLGARDPRARVTWGGFSNRSAQNIWTGLGFTQAIGATNTSDIAVSVGFNIGNLAPGASTTLSYAYVLSAADLANALESISNPAMVANGINVGTSGSVTTCGSPVNLNIADGASSTWTWSPAAGLSATTGTSVVANPAVTTTYTAIGAGTCGSDTLQITVNVTPGANADAGPDVSTCSGTPVTIGGLSTGTGALSYTWSPATGLSCTTCPNPVATTAVTRNYTLTVVDAAGCTDSDIMTVFVVPGAPVTITCPADITRSCDGPSTPDVTGTATASGGCGGAPIVTYSDAVSGSAPCNYTITRTWTATSVVGGTSASCVQTITTQDNVAPTLTAAASGLTVECDGGGNVASLTAWLNSHGGANATDNCYDVSWTNNFVGLSDGCGSTGSATVTFTASDACGNAVSTTATFAITDNVPPAISCPANLNVSCIVDVPAASASDASATDACGDPNVVFLGQFDNGASGCAGSPRVITRNYRATDACGNASNCSQTITVEAAPLTGSVSSPVQPNGYNVTCNAANGSPDGTATASFTGGCAPYTYAWSNGQTTATATGLGAGTHSVTVTSVNGCTATGSVTLTAPDAIVITGTTCAVVTPGWAAGACANLTVSGVTGGTAPYTYAWSTGATTATINVCPTVTTTYTVTVTDGAGCTATQTATVTANDARCGKSGDKVLVCHVPPGNPAAAHTICIAAPAVNAHVVGGGVGHGTCYVGPCNFVDPCGPTVIAPRMAGDEAASLTAAAFPNPFSSSTTVEFTAARSEHVTVKVYNLSGADMGTLFDGEVQAGVRNTASFSPEQAAAGIYFARITTASGEVSVLKLVLQN